jgi:hypothetical protein
MRNIQLLPVELTTLTKLTRLTLDCCNLTDPYNVLRAFEGDLELNVRTAGQKYDVQKGERDAVMKEMAMYDFLDRPYASGLVCSSR